MDELTRERYPFGVPWSERYRPAVHPFAGDGNEWLDRVPRCARCGLPRVNRAHKVPDVERKQQEHQRRTGEKA